MKKIFTLSLLLFLSVQLWAVPAKPGLKRLITLEDGTQVMAQLKGDEFLSWWQTDDGKTYQYSPSTKLYKATDITAKMHDASELRMKANAVRKAKARKLAPRNIGEPDHTEYKGVKKGLCILVQFTDKTFKTSHKIKYYQRIFNGPLSNTQKALGFKSSVKDYFTAQSNGAFELDFDVVGPYTLSHDYAYYGAPSETSHDSRPGTMIKEAVNLAANDVDFSQYDWDGDGEVDQIYVLYAGYGQAAGGDENTIWPHEWQLTASEYGSYIEKNGVKIDTYACGCELTDQYSGGRVVSDQPDGIGTICHEFSHCLGLPDMYDTEGGNYGTGDFDVMCSGSYNGNSYSPANYTAYERWYAGWLEPTVLDKATTVKGLKSSTDYGSTFVVYNDEHKDEYYLIENRQQDGNFDVAIPEAGLMITHVDYDENIWYLNNVNTEVNYSDTYGQQYAIYDNDHERMAIVHADGRATSSHIYPYGGNTELTDTSSPAATLYNGTKGYLGKPITNITQNADGTMSFDFMGGSTSNVITGIKTVKSIRPTDDGKIYSLDGKYLGTDMSVLQHGIYIVGGKKIVK